MKKDDSGHMKPSLFSDSPQPQDAEDARFLQLRDAAEVKRLARRKRIEAIRLAGETFEEAEQRFLHRRNAHEEAPLNEAEVGTRSSVRRPPKDDSQQDFFVPKLYDVGTRDSRSVMDVAIFRLSKRERRASDTITYELSDGKVTVTSGPAGMASVWDYDLILMAVSHLTEAMNRYREGKGEKPGRVFRPHMGDVLKFLRRTDGGKQKSDLVETCLRLNTTHVAIQRLRAKRNGKSVIQSKGEALISRYDVITNAATNAPEFLEIEIAQWIYLEVTEGKNPDVLTVHPDYFLIDPGIGRFVYRLARKAAGRTTARWSFHTIYERSGSSGTYYKFSENLRKVINANDLPEYDLREEAGQSGAQLVMTHRQYAQPLEQPEE